MNPNSWATKNQQKTEDASSGRWSGSYMVYAKPRWFLVCMLYYVLCIFAHAFGLNKVKELFLDFHLQRDDAWDARNGTTGMEECVFSVLG